jgi:YtxH-like protein
MARSSTMDYFRNNNPFDTRGWRYQARNMMTPNNRFSITTFGGGVLLGVGIALLLAPKSGRELRDDLTRRAGEIGDTVRNRLPAMNEHQNDHDRYATNRQQGNPTT